MLACQHALGKKTCSDIKSSMIMFVLRPRVIAMALHMTHLHMHVLAQVHDAACSMLAQAAGRPSIEACTDIMHSHVLPPRRQPDVSVLVDAHRAKATIMCLLMASSSADLQRNLNTSEPVTHRNLSSESHTFSLPSCSYAITAAKHLPSADSYLSREDGCIGSMSRSRDILMHMGLQI